jgi:hypothetical protein
VEYRSFPLNVQSFPLNAKSFPLKAKVLSAQRSITLRKSNSQKKQLSKTTLGPAPFFRANLLNTFRWKSPSQNIGPTGSPTPRRPPKAGGVKVTWGDPIPGFRFRCGDNPGYVNLSTGLLTSFEEAQRVAQMEAN